MTETPLPGDIRQIDMANDLLYDDVNKPDIGDDEDIGDFEPGDDVEEHEEVDIDDLPDVGEVDLNEEPVLDDDEEWNPEWDNAEHGEYTEEKETGVHDPTPEEIAKFDKEAGE